MSNNLKNGIDNAAGKAKKVADKAAAAIKHASKKVAAKTHGVADKIKQHGTRASKKSAADSPPVRVLASTPLARAASIVSAVARRAQLSGP